MSDLPNGQSTEDFRGNFGKRGIPSIVDILNEASPTNREKVLALDSYTEYEGDEIPPGLQRSLRETHDPSEPLPETPAIILTDKWEDIPVANREELIQWVARGYTLRRIHHLALQDHWPVLPTIRVLINLRNAAKDPELAARVLSERDSSEGAVLTFGLARKAERIRRMSQLAERIEDKLGIDSPEAEYEEHQQRPIPEKLAKLYLDVQKQIQSETETLGIKLKINPDDEWLVLLRDLKDRTALPGPTQGPQANSLELSSIDSDSSSTPSKSESSSILDVTSSSPEESAPANPSPPPSN